MGTHNLPCVIVSTIWRSNTHLIPSKKNCSNSKRLKMKFIEGELESGREMLHFDMNNIHFNYFEESFDYNQNALILNHRILSKN